MRWWTAWRVRTPARRGPARGAVRTRKAAREVVAHFRRHMEIEDRVVLPAAAALGADALAAMADEMERRRTEGSRS